MEIQARARRRHLRDDPDRRAHLQESLTRWLDLPLALASVLFVLLTVIQLTTPLPASRRALVAAVETAIWAFFLVSFVSELVLAPDRLRFLRRHWMRAITVVVPFLGFLRALAVLRVAQWAPYLRLLLFGHRTGSPALEILRRRHLGKVALVSLMVVGIATSLEYLVEAGAPGSNIENLGDALWWAAATTTTIGSPLYPVTAGGKVVAVLLMLYSVSVFTYFVASLASALTGHDEVKKEATPEAGVSVRLSPEEAAALRKLVERLPE
jgi:voltage-gated potassium channel